MGYNRNFVVMFNTMNYYPMFKGCQYKYSKANHKEVMVLNVDINSTEQNKKIGMEKVGYINWSKGQNGLFILNTMLFIWNLILGIN